MYNYTLECRHDFDMHQSNDLVSTGRFVAAMATSIVRLNAEPFGLIVTSNIP